MKNGRKTIAKRIFAIGMAVVVALSIIMVPEQTSYAAGGRVKTVTVTNLPAKQLTLKKGKIFTLKPKVTITGKISKKVVYKTSNKKVVTVNTKGKLTAKKKGTAKVYVISKADKKKKCTITVTVGTPVTKVKLNKTRSTMTVGKKQTLKVTVTPKKASSKAVIWKSSNTKIATVTSKGVVKAKKTGTVTITATAKDGSGKKAVCKITVKKPAASKPAKPQPDDPNPVVPDNKIQKVEVLGKTIIRVTMSGKQKLGMSDFCVYGKAFTDERYEKQYKLESAATKDDQVYLLRLSYENYLSTGDKVQVSIPKYNLAMETTYLGQVSEWTTSETIMESADFDRMDHTYQYKPDAVGRCSFKISGEIPEGISYTEKNGSSQTNEIRFTGKFQNAGEWKTRIEVTDQLGHKIHHTIIWKIYDAHTLAVKDEELHGYRQDVYGGRGYSDYRRLDIRGGSGRYTYQVLDKPEEMAFSPYSKTYSINTKNTGTYTMKVQISDQMDPLVSTVATITYIISDGIRFSGQAYDLDGHLIKDASDAAYSLTFLPQNVDDPYNNSIYVESKRDGTYSAYVPEGTYDVLISGRGTGTETWLYDVVAGKNDQALNVILPVYQITIQSDDKSVDITSFQTWREDGTIRGYGNVIYLPVGHHTLTGATNIRGVRYKAEVQINDVTRSVTVTAHIEAQ